MSHPRHLRQVRRAVAALATAGLGLTLLAGPSSATAPPSSPAGKGGTWLVGQLRHGLIHNGQFHVYDYGLTADTALALHAVGHHRTALFKIRRALARNVNAYTTYKTDRYAGPTAKLLVVAEDNGAAIRNFGGVDLVTRLENRVATTAPIAGRIQDKSTRDYANTVGQVFAVRGLLRAHSTSAGPALDFLLQQQCTRGSFRLDFTTDKQATEQGCTAQDDPDTDVTALAVVELWSLRNTSPELKAGLDSAVAWLRQHQRSNGSFGGGPTTSAANSNSTGLAGWALGLAGRCYVASRAAHWVRAQQVQGPLAGTPLAGQGGAIAYDHAALRTAKKQGITGPNRDQWRRATAQAAPALQFLHGC